MGDAKWVVRVPYGDGHRYLMLPPPGEEPQKTRDPKLAAHLDEDRACAVAERCVGGFAMPLERAGMLKDEAQARSLDYARLTIVSDGTGPGTYVCLNGRALEGVVLVEWRCARQGTEAVLHVRGGVSVEHLRVDGSMQRVDVEASRGVHATEPIPARPTCRKCRKPTLGAAYCWACLGPE